MRVTGMAPNYSKASKHALLSDAVQGRASELQVLKRNSRARKLYDTLGYVGAAEGEYMPQRTYQYMKRPEGVMEASPRHGVDYI